MTADTEVPTAPASPGPDAGLDAGSADPAPRTGGITTITRWVLPMVMLCVVYVALVRRAAAPLSNFDTYFHLRFGHELLGPWSLSHPGSPTTYGTADWVPTQWLPQMLMAVTEDHLGLAGVAWLSGLQFVALAVALYAAGRRVAGPVVVVPVLAVVMIGCTSGLSMRPQVLSYLAVAITVAAWGASRRSGRAPWLLVPLTWVWAMCHGMWPIGVVIGLAAVVGLTLDGRLRGRTLLRHAAVPVLGLLAGGLLTPVGPSLLPAVLLVSSRGQYFSEWAAPSFTSVQPLLVLALLGLTLLLMLRRGRPDWFTVALVGLAGAFLVYSMRTVPVAACLLMPLLATELQRMVGDRPAVRRPELAVVVGGAAVALAGLALVVPSTSATPPPQPTWVDPALSALPAGTVVLDDSSFGGYLMWRFPDLDFMFSGYGDVYTDTEIEDMSQIGDLDPGWDDLVRDARPEYALLVPEAPLTYALRKDGWTVVHDDPEIQMLAPPAGWMDR